MNALEIIEQVRAHNAELLIEDERLILRGRGERLPEELQAALKENKAAVMVALGAPHDSAVASVLSDIRPHLPPAMQRVSDSNLLVLVNWAILHAFNKSVREFRSDDR